MEALSGYWGEADTNTAFCEPKYAHSSFIAEFVNSSSSLLYILFGCYGTAMALQLGLKPRFIFAFVTLVITGCGR